MHSSQPCSSCLQSLIMSASERHLCRYNCLVNKIRNIRFFISCHTSPTFLQCGKLQHGSLFQTQPACQTDHFVLYPICIFTMEWIMAVRAFTFGRYEDVFEATNVSYCSVKTWIRRNLQWISISPAFVLNVLCVWTHRAEYITFICIFFTAWKVLCYSKGKK